MHRQWSLLVETAVTVAVSLLSVSWAGRFMSMLEMICGKGYRDEKDAVKDDFVSCCGYEATADHVWAVPRGIVWDAWDRMLQEPWEGLPTEPRTADTSKIRLITYQNWFAVPQQIEGQKEKGYPEGMPGYIKRTSDIPLLRSYSCGCVLEHTIYG